MDNDNNSDQFLTLQALNNVPGNVMALSPPSNAPSVHLQELSTGNSLASSNPGNLIGNLHQFLHFIKKIQCILHGIFNKESFTIRFRYN